ncbi:MAG: hypothetical protein K2K41_00650 [Ruminiclostridium sp.]|nr:hypothetical protein [Ruminiclostridium sp.]
MIYFQNEDSRFPLSLLRARGGGLHWLAFSECFCLCIVYPLTVRHCVIVGSNPTSVFCRAKWFWSIGNLAYNRFSTIARKGAELGILI